MKVLLDTHTFLWWITDAPQLPPGVRQIIAEGSNSLFFSAASGWEIAIKARLGKLYLPKNLESFLAEQLALNTIDPLPVLMRHALHTYALPDYHRDPFDRLIVAQAELEDMPILTADAQIRRYPVKVIW